MDTALKFIDTTTHHLGKMPRKFVLRDKVKGRELKVRVRVNEDCNNASLMAKNGFLTLVLPKVSKNTFIIKPVEIGSIGDKKVLISASVRPASQLLFSHSKVSISLFEN